MNKENLLKKLEYYSKHKDALIVQLHQLEGVILYISNEINELNPNFDKKEISKKDTIA